MKICFLTDTIFLHGGVARVLTTIANELCKDNDITILCMYKFEENNIYSINRKKIDIKYFDDIKKCDVNKVKRVIRKVVFKNKVLDKEIFNEFKSKIKFPGEVTEPIIEYINQNNFDIVVGVHIDFSMILGMIKEKINAKTIGWQHNSFKAYFETKNKYVWNQVNLYKYLTNKLDVNLVLTEDDKNKYKEILGLDVEVMNNPNSFIPSERSNLKNNKFLAVGRLVEQKGFDLLIEAFNYFRKNGGEWTLDIVGEGEWNQKLIELVKKYNLERVIRIKPFTDDIEKEYISSDVYILSSRYEGWGLVWIEAMSCGLPIISFRLPACEEVIGKNNVGIIVTEDIEKLGEAMLTISKRESLIDLSNNALNLSKEYNVENITKRWKKLFIN